MGKTKTISQVVRAITPLAVKSSKAAIDKRKSEQQRNNELLFSLNEKLDKQLSFKENLKLGIVRGAASAIGATLIAALVLTLLSKLVNTVDDVPILRDIIEQTKIEKTIER